MVEFNKPGSILMSLFFGVLLSFLFDNVFILVFIGFLSTYLTNTDEKTYLVGIVTALIYATGNFIRGLFITPPIPQAIITHAPLDTFNLLVGFLVTLLIAAFLGFVGAYPVHYTNEHFKKNKYKF
ncbi:MAG: hypothetical protein LBC39_06195 [Methanobrevibacter sp.]|jgi:hypothetical protein|nr:hypothetical protein [Candidatus Methanovirga aequatorialis]